MTHRPFTLSLKAVILDNQQRVLLVRRSMASKGNPGNWDFPGGKLNAGETLEEALPREVAEETGLKIALRRVLGSAESESPTKRIAYLILEADLVSGEIRLSDEHDDHCWVSPSELMAMDVAGQFKAFAGDYSRVTK